MDWAWCRPPWDIVEYADMPVKTQHQHTLLRQLPAALSARMKADGLTQERLSQLLSIGQPQISRALAGRRKRLTEPMRALCRYANLMTEDQSANDMQAKLNALVQDLVGDSPPAAKMVENVLLSLAPALEALRSSRK